MYSTSRTEKNIKASLRHKQKTTNVILTRKSGPPGNKLKFRGQGSSPREVKPKNEKVKDSYS